ncbi:hypothetical protein SLEP1_g15782 [Rubroshorea leprosula]|uniref:Amino acid transporter transmembrane domain-containing protein n=1 Tax=Rubroshorea leprosula TaxID=152421 RepID=A0AAV5IXP2_9ROSI|nr:hypothetical protein SLEP1_g15782 [Rubroshorea leprosula]
MEAVRSYLGGTKYKACGWVQYIYLSGMIVGYTITASISMVRDHDGDPCKFANNPNMIALGILEILVSQTETFTSSHGSPPSLARCCHVCWVCIYRYRTSPLQRLCQVSFNAINMFDVIPKPLLVQQFNAADKVWTMLRAVGDMAFAFAYSTALIEIQETLRSSPPENQTMKEANTIGVSTATTLCLFCSCLGYAAFGDRALAQTVFNVVEAWLYSLWPESNLITKEYPVNIDRRKLSFSLLRLVWRTLFVVMATVLEMALPFFNDILAFLGAIGFWPMTVYFPVEMLHCSEENQTAVKKLGWTLGL